VRRYQQAAHELARSGRGAGAPGSPPRAARRGMAARTVRTARMRLRPMDETDLDALVELDGFEEVRSAIDPFAEHIPGDPAERREDERRFPYPAGFLP